MLRRARWLAVLGAPVITGCVGHFVTVTKQVVLNTPIAIRENGAFNDFAQVDLSDMVKAKSDIGEDAEILSMTITALGADVNPLPTTNAAEMTFALSIRDAAGNVSSITENATLGNDSEFLPLSVKSAITMIPQKAINAALTGLQDQLNAFLRSSANVTLLVGFTGTTTGGRADVDMVAKITLSVTFKKCVDGPPTALVSTGSESCLR